MSNTKHLLALLKNLKPNDILKFKYKEDSANLTEEPFNVLFMDDTFDITRIDDDIVYNYIPAHDMVYSWDYKQLTQELSFYSIHILKNASKQNLKEIIRQDFAFEEYFSRNKEDEYENIINEMKRVGVDLTKYELIEVP